MQDLLGPPELPGLTYLPGFADTAPALVAAVEAIAAAAPFRVLVTPGGKAMSVGMTNCGPLGWVSDRRGYRYSATDPETGLPWPEMPELFSDLATRAAAAAGFAGFEPDACLINRYAPGAKMGLHRDYDEKDLRAPIVSVSLGLPAVFLWGGQARTDKTVKLPVTHGDVVVFGGEGRLHYHGVLPVKDGIDPLLGRSRVNLTFRKAI